MGRRSRSDLLVLHAAHVVLLPFVLVVAIELVVHTVVVLRARSRRLAEDSTEESFAEAEGRLEMGLALCSSKSTSPSAASPPSSASSSDSRKRAGSTRRLGRLTWSGSS